MKKNRKITYERLYHRAQKYRVHNFILSLVLIALLAGVYFVMNDILTAYENAQMNHVVDRVLADLNGGEWNWFLKDKALSPYAEETDEFYEANIHELELCTPFSVSARPAVAPDSRHKCYNLYADDTSIARLTLVISDKKAKYGFNQWEVESCPFTAVFLHPTSYTVRAPETSQVVANGRILTEEDAVETMINEHTSHLPEGAPSQNERVYRFTLTKGEPEILVTDINGRAQTLERSDNAFTAARNLDEIPEEFSSLAQNVIQGIAQYSAGLKDEGAATQYAEKNSPAAGYLHEYGHWKSQKASRGRFENYSCENYVRVDEHTFFLDVRIDFICTYNVKDDAPYYLSYTMYFSDRTGSWLLYDFVTR